MKTRTLFCLIGILVSTAFTHVAIGQEYTYELTVISLSEEEQPFDIEISSQNGSSSEAIKTVLSNQTTPFRRSLESGKHIVVVEHPEESGRVESKITGLVGVLTKGSAAGDYRKTTLTAGPGGHFSASK